MTQTIFYCDGKNYDVAVRSLKINGTKMSSTDTGRLNNLSMYIKYDGVFINYDIEISRRDNNSNDLFELFHNLLFDEENPIHTVSFPYGNTVYEFEAYVSDTSISLERIMESNNIYSPIAISFIAVNKADSPFEKAESMI